MCYDLVNEIDLYTELEAAKSEYERLLEEISELKALIVSLTAERDELKLFDDKQMLNYLHNQKIRGETLPDNEEKVYRELYKKFTKIVNLRVKFFKLRFSHTKTIKKMYF